MLRIEATDPNLTTRFWQVLDGDRLVCVANIRAVDGGVQNTKCGSLTTEQRVEVELLYRNTVTRHAGWCDLNNDGFECNCDYGLPKEKL